MKPEHIKTLIETSLQFLPLKMRSKEAMVLLHAIGLQESGFKYRKQMQGGPAKGFWQFETTGVRGVVTHQSTRPIVRELLDGLIYADATVADIHANIQHNDTLACCMARLLLWTLPTALTFDPQKSWEQYLAAWRPGKPKPETWAKHYFAAMQETGK